MPLTSAKPSLGCRSKNPEAIPACLKASSAVRDSPLGPVALEFGRPVRRPAM